VKGLTEFQTVMQLQVCRLIFNINIPKIKTLNVLPQHFQWRTGQDASAV
jgi:hypothetical protein